VLDFDPCSVTAPNIFSQWISAEPSTPVTKSWMSSPQPMQIILSDDEDSRVSGFDYIGDRDGKGRWLQNEPRYDRTIQFFHLLKGHSAVKKFAVKEFT
jgi:hypothetical protein